MSDHNTLDDLVRVAMAFVPLCDRCAVAATRIGRDLYLCDAHAARGDRELPLAPVVRRLVAAGVLTALALTGCTEPSVNEAPPFPLAADEVAAWDMLHAGCVARYRPGGDPSETHRCADEGILRRRARMAKVKP